MNRQSLTVGFLRRLVWVSVRGGTLRRVLSYAHDVVVPFGAEAGGDSGVVQLIDERLVCFR